jgi:endoglucanase
VLSNGLAWLSVASRQIVVDASRQPVLLRGVNRSGLEYAEPDARGFLDAAGISDSEIACMIRDWGAKIIRIPFNQDWALNGRGQFSAAAYLEAIDQVIFWASRAGAYTMLDLQWLDAEVVRGLNRDGSSNRVPSLPTTDSIVVWSILAHRYRAEPAVLFDVFNEPHNPIRNDPSALAGIHEDGTTFPLTRRRVTMAEWQPWARHLVRAIRREHPRSLVFVSGVSWAYDLRGMPLTIANGSQEPFPNTVYSTHVYPWSGTPAGARHTSFSFARHRALSWSDAFGRLSRCAPVFVAEWGGGPQHVGWGLTLVRYLRRLGIGWTAWSWSDRPRLVVDAQAQRYEPTDFGRVVRRSLTGIA